MARFILLILMLFSLSSFAVTTITTIGKQKPDDASHDYFTGILRLALIKTNDEYGDAVLHTTPYSGQKRTLKFLALGAFYDVI